MLFLFNTQRETYYKWFKVKYLLSVKINKNIIIHIHYVTGWGFLCEAALTRHMFICYLWKQQGIKISQYQRCNINKKKRCSGLKSEQTIEII